MESKATWIWYPGDFEVWLGNRFNNCRTERGAMFPPFWRQDSHWPTVVFRCRCEVPGDETISIAAEGHYSLSVDGRLQYGMPRLLTVPKGCHELSVKVWNQATPPALYVSGATIRSGPHWQATCEDKLWIDECGVAHGSGIYVPAAAWCFDAPGEPPSAYRLKRREQLPATMEETAPGTVLYDFGRETFGYLKCCGLKGTVRVYYGESREEALDKEHCETLDVLSTTVRGDAEAGSKAFRYVCIERQEGAEYERLLMDYEYAPFDPSRSGSFRCSDDELNRIWHVAAYTLDLTTREFFCDGIKRDRWTWSGDAIQSYLMNYYLRFDTACVKRTIRQLRGKDPVTAHVNTIMDYTFYWFISIGQYYQYTADAAFIHEMWPKMVTLMDYVLSRLNDDGMAYAKAGDWVFVDWADFPMHKRGALCFEQLLLAKALLTMAQCAGILCLDDGTRYARLAARLLARTRELFWSQEAHAYLHAMEDGRLNAQVTKYPNMFAILCGFATPAEAEQIQRHVLLGSGVPPVTTPYMRFYELEALCRLGLHAKVLRQMKDYWGGMLRLGATTFWEKYNPCEQGAAHLAMYGRPYGKSLCHSWGASPLYLLGRYFLGVSPAQPGYAHYEVRPRLGGLQWMEGSVPTPFGRIQVAMNTEGVTVFSDGGEGTLVVDDRSIPIPPNKPVSMRIDGDICNV